MGFLVWINALTEDTFIDTFGMQSNFINTDMQNAKFAGYISIVLYIMQYPGGYWALKKLREWFREQLTFRIKAPPKSDPGSTPMVYENGSEEEGSGAEFERM